jgi:hypothetical protein
VIAIATSSKKTINGYAVRRRRNPFITGTHAGIGDVQACDTESRIDMVRNFSAEQCRAALKLRYLQKTVRVALDRRLRALEAKS